MHNGFRFTSSNWIIARYEVPRAVVPRIHTHSVESWPGSYGHVPLSRDLPRESFFPRSFVRSFELR